MTSASSAASSAARPSYSIAASGIIAAPAAACYAAIADYRGSHPKIVPPKYFGPIVVESGGVGAGTRIRCSLRMLGRTFPFTSEITEPEPGRLLVETVVETGVVTSFGVVSEGAAQTRVTIATRLQRAPGLRGTLERLTTRRIFPRIYVEELERLAGVVGGRLVGTPTISRLG